MLGLMNGKNEKMRSYSAEASRLRTQIQQTKEEIDAARNHFEQAVDPTLIDCYIYEINAAEEAAAGHQKAVRAKSQTP